MEGNASGQASNPKGRYKFAKHLEFLRPHIGNDGKTINPVTMWDTAERLTQPDPPAQNDPNLPLSNAAADPSQTLPGSSSQTNPVLPNAAAGPSQTPPASSSQTTPIRRHRTTKTHECECMTLMSQSFDKLTQKFEEETWTMALNLTATIKPLPAAQRRELITQIDDVIANFFKKNAP